MKSARKKRSAPRRERFAILAADVVCFSLRDDGRLCVRLMNVNIPPHFRNAPGLPGGLIRPEETAEKAAHRLLKEKGLIGKSKPYVEQLYTMSSIKRDPQGRVVSVAYLALIPWQSLTPNEKESTEEAWWDEVPRVRHLAYDHDDILSIGLERLRTKVRYTTLVRTLMPRSFTLTELEKTLERIIGTRFDKRNFRRKILSLGILRKTQNIKSGSRHRPARLWRFRDPRVAPIEIF